MTSPPHNEPTLCFLCVWWHHRETCLENCLASFAYSKGQFKAGANAERTFLLVPWWSWTFCCLSCNLYTTLYSYYCRYGTHYLWIQTGLFVDRRPRCYTSCFVSWPKKSPKHILKKGQGNIPSQRLSSVAVFTCTQDSGEKVNTLLLILVYMQLNILRLATLRAVRSLLTFRTP